VRLVYLYGPPAAGKLTIATILAKKTGFKLFHNHLSVDVVEALFPFGAPHFFDNVVKIRLQLLDAAAEHGVEGVIFTFVYARPNDDAFVDRVCSIVESRGGRVDLVQLVCDQATLERRVAEPSRARYRKISDVATLREKLAWADLMSPVSSRGGLTIDSTQPPEESARRIIERLRLPTL
jgi:hypothetical protein